MEEAERDGKVRALQARREEAMRVDGELAAQVMNESMHGEIGTYPRIDIYSYRHTEREKSHARVHTLSPLPSPSAPPPTPIEQAAMEDAFLRQQLKREIGLAEVERARRLRRLEEEHAMLAQEVFVCFFLGFFEP